MNSTSTLTLAEILERLKTPIPHEFVSQKSFKGNNIDYVAWYDLAEILDQRCGLGNWNWTIKNIYQIGDNLTLTGCLTIHGKDKSLTMDATGCEAVTVSGYGDPSSNAEAMALRRCCAKFGLGRSLWRKDKQSSTSTTKQAKGQISREEWLRRRATEAN